MTVTLKQQAFFRGFVHVMAGLAIIAGMALATVSPVSAAPPFSNARYCKNANQSNCLQPLVVSIVGHCSTNTIDLNFTNPNSVDGPRTIAVFRDGQEVFGDDGFAAPGDSVLTYGPFVNATWRVVVTWDGRTFADTTVVFPC